MNAMAYPIHSRFRLSSRGVSLIEILVGIAIGLIGMLVMFQMVTVWDARTRVATSSGDAQIAGSVAMFTLDRDLKLAGMGFGNAGTAELGCNVAAFDNNASGAANFFLRPITITDGDPTGQPDAIEVLYGDSAFFEQGEEFTNSTASTLATTTKFGFKPGDVAVVTDGANTCRLIQITDDSSPDVHILSYATGSYTNYYDGLTKPTRWNTTAASMPAISAGNIYSMGPSPRHNIWSVDTTTTTLGFVTG